MKRYIISRLMLLWIAYSSISFYSVADSITHTVIYNQIPQIGTSTLGEVSYTTVNYGELSYSGDPGMPLLPVDYIKFSVPYNATNISVSAIEGNCIIYNTESLLYPCQKQVELNEYDETIYTMPDSTVYNSGQYYPNERAWIVDEGFIAGENHVVTVAIAPVDYLHTSSQDTLRIFDNIQITLNYERSDSLVVYPLIRNDMSLRSDGFRLTESLVVNPREVVNNALNVTSMNNLDPIYTGGIPLPSSDYIDSISNSHVNIQYSNIYPNYDYMIITPDSLKQPLKRIAALKRQKGYNVGIVTVEEIISKDRQLPWYQNIQSTQMSDSARIIREYLRFAYCIGHAKFILLAGRDVPFKYAWHGSIPTDQYYVDLNSDWLIPSMYSMPELFVGRIIAKNTEQINNYTDKLFRYELNPGNGDFSYLRKAIYTNGIEQVVGQSTFTEIVRHRADLIFPEALVMEEDRDRGFPTGTDVINQLNNRYSGFISFNSHGLPLGIVTYGKGGPAPHQFRWLWAIENQRFSDSITNHVHDDTSTGNGLDNMLNKMYPSICFSTACSVMPLDVMPGYEKGSTNFGESFTTGKNYGGPAFVGNTRDNGFEVATLHRVMMHILYEGNSKLGMALAMGKTHGSNEQCSLKQNLLGDPEFEVWTDEPQYYSQINVTRNNHSITISGMEADSTIIAFVDNDMKHRLFTVSDSSLTLFNISPNSAIMLYKQNRIPYIAPMLLQNVTLSNSQYLIANSVSAGNSVDSNRTGGNVIVADGIEYEIEASGTVRLEDGFKVEKGATFAVYPACF